MGQKQTTPYSEFQKQYTIVSKNQNDQLLVRHKLNGKQCMLRKLIVKSEQQLQERITLLNKRKKIKSQHLLNIIDFKPVTDDKICGHAQYISLLIEYPFQSLCFQTLHRLNLNTGRSSASRLSPIYYQEHELWSILYSCTLGLEVLYLTDLPHQSITKDIIFIDKEGVVKIGDPIVIGARRNFQRVLQMIETQKNKESQQQNKQLKSSNFYNDKNQQYLKRLNHIKQQQQLKNDSAPQSERLDLQKVSSKKTLSSKSIIPQDESFIISPQLISLCKDQQYYFFDKQKSDVFVLGALMIELALLENVASVNLKQNILRKDYAEFFNQKSKLKERYSNIFISLLQQMTRTDPKQRPTLTQVVERIQQFSIQQNSQSDINSLKHNSTDLGNNFEKKNLFPTSMDFASIKENQLYSFKAFQNNLHKQYEKTDNISTSSYIPEQKFKFTSARNDFSENLNNRTGPAFQPFPSFSLQSNINNVHKNTTGNYHESAVKTIFSKNIPIQVKYAESPLMLPVSNMGTTNKNLFNQNISTPFHHLNLTESNQKKDFGKDLQKQSIVQNKFTLFGVHNNYGPSSLFDKYKGPQPNQQLDSQRFSMNKFGKINLPNNSNQSSVHTSMIPTPRFESSSILQSNYPSNDVSRPLFNSIPSSNYGFNLSALSQSNQNTQWNNTNLNNNLIPNQQNSNYHNQNSSYSAVNTSLQRAKNNVPVNTNYNPKKQGFSISDSYADSKQSQIDKNQQPYFTNSSVGYTLPKYRPQSSSSEVIKISQKNQNTSKLNQNSDEPYKNKFQNSKNQVYSSFNDNFQQQNLNKQLKRYNSSASSMINSVSILAHETIHPVNNIEKQTDLNDKQRNLNDKQRNQKLQDGKNQTISNSSSQNTVKKQNLINRHQSSQKKYNFYKKQLNEPLQKIQVSHKLQRTIPANQLSQISSISMIQNISQHKISQNPNNQSPIHQRNFVSQQNLASQSNNSITPVTFEPQLHSVYVQQRQQNGSFYKGNKLNGKRHGSGILIFADSGFYDGQFNNDFMEGQGKLYYNQTDLAYEGQFIKGNFHGRGVLYNNQVEQLKGKFDFANLSMIQNSWRIYDGYFKDDLKAGKCRIILTNGEQFQGYCQNNTFQGYGRYKNLDGQYVDGYWHNNVLVKVTNQGKITDLNTE